MWKIWKTLQIYTLNDNIKIYISVNAIQETIILQNLNVKCM